ncbi:hypothetical protein BDV09DRAFT_173720 [Aspergillus tetrazonus]
MDGSESRAFAQLQTLVLQCFCSTHSSVGQCSMSLGLMALRPKNASRILRVCLLWRDVIADGGINPRTDSGRNADACPLLSTCF